ncbi:hypothetical protein IQ244_12640 [Nostoc sp. LEGE 06077]|uniref:hypothetical protein n=1 Tax=Nostoc sp. LEGE 06077 TaxID=915325 RepID=UPI001881B3BF|nr:hypothetical protein [Nostoc sp. LEGE 06077]MBE9207354.1 hypothetical protein [Nostoc sp. LEGE 06077]
MTQLKMSSSPRFVDFGYEPGTLVLGGMWLNMKVFALMYTVAFPRERLGRGKTDSRVFKTLA